MATAGLGHEAADGLLLWGFLHNCAEKASASDVFCMDGGLPNGPPPLSSLSSPFSAGWETGWL